MYRLAYLFLLLIALSSGLEARQVDEPGVLESILNFQTISATNSKIDELYAESSILRRDLGISLVASYNHRFGEGFIDNDLNAGSIEKYYKTGLNWEILKAGWVQNRRLAETNDLRVELELLEQQVRDKQESYFAQFALAAYLFDKEIHDVYLERIQLLSSKRPIYASLREEGYFTNEEVFNLNSRFEEARLEKEILFQSNSSFEHIFSEELNTFNYPYQVRETLMPDVDISAILESFNDMEGHLKMVEMRKELIRAPSYFIYDMSLTASVNYHHQTSFSDNTRDYVAMGISLRMPLARNRRAIRDSYVAESKALDEGLQLEVKNRKKEMLMLYQEYSYKQKQLLNLVSKYTLLEDRIRVQEVTKASVNTDIPEVDASLLQDDALAVLIEQVALKKQMHQLLLKMNLNLTSGEIIDYLVYDDEEKFITSRKGL